MTRPTVLAADVGGTHMRAALVDAQGVVLLRESVATPGHAAVPDALIDLIGRVGAEHGHGTVARAVVGLPGGIDYVGGRLLWAPHLPEQWTDDAVARRVVGSPRTPGRYRERRRLGRRR